MMNEEIFIKIIELAVLVLITILTKYLIPFIKAKMSKSQMEMFIDYVNIAVKAASQIYTKEQWAEKKDYCMNYLTNVANEQLELHLSEEDISVLVEGVLNGLKATGELLIKE